MSRTWKLPAPGDIVWCLFPEIPDIEPGPKPRPALVMSVERREDGDLVSVVYGTSQEPDPIENGRGGDHANQTPGSLCAGRAGL
jgi:hypothetical protein